MNSSNLSALENFTAWNSLISSGDLTSIQSMLEKGEISRKDKLGEYELSPLHLAAWHNQPEICKFLISQKVPPDVREVFSGKSHLHIAAYFGHLEAAETLIDLGTTIVGRKAVDFLGCYPLHYAALGEQREMLLSLLKLGHFRLPL